LGCGDWVSIGKVLKWGINHYICSGKVLSSRKNTYINTEIFSGSEAGSYLRRIDFVYHSTLGVRVSEKRRKKCKGRQAPPESGLAFGDGSVGQYRGTSLIRKSPSP
jgi:hypothetical protein